MRKIIMLLKSLYFLQIIKKCIINTYFNIYVSVLRLHDVVSEQNARFVHLYSPCKALFLPGCVIIRFSIFVRLWRVYNIKNGINVLF